MGQLGHESGDEPPDDQAEAGLVDVEELAERVEIASPLRLRQRCRQRGAAEEDGRSWCDSPAVAVDDDALSLGRAEVESDRAVADRRHAQGNRLGLGPLGVALQRPML
jgi:hypothetical protein